MQNVLKWPLPLAYQPMQNRPVQTSNRTKIGADSISNRTKIGTNAINRTRLTKISAVPDRTKISANLILQLIKISAVPNRTKISANHIYTIAKSSSIMHMPHAKANCTSRVLIRKVFNDKVI
jgi:hypothetical protein